VLGHTTPHPPQLEVDDSLVSHPWETLAVQWVHPGAQDDSGNAHCPALHDTGPLT
jgi:hypothetical protein